MPVKLILDMTDNHPTPHAYTPVKVDGSYESSIQFAQKAIRTNLRHALKETFAVRITTPAMYKHFDWLDGLDGVTVESV